MEFARVIQTFNVSRKAGLCLWTGSSEARASEGETFASTTRDGETKTRDISHQRDAPPVGRLAGFTQLL